MSQPINHYIEPTWEIVQALKLIKDVLNKFSFKSKRAILASILSKEWEDYFRETDRKYISGSPSRKFLKGHLLDGWGWFDFMDHPGKMIVEGEEMATFEPYGIGLGGVKELIKYAEDNDFYVTINSKSPYYPGSTILITLKDAKSKLAPFSP